MIDYLKANLLNEGIELNSRIEIEHDSYGKWNNVTWNDFINFLSQMPEYFNKIRRTLVKINLDGGDIIKYLKGLVSDMVNKGEISP